MNFIRPIVKKRLNEKKKLGDAWVVPSDALQSFLNCPEIAPDLNPDNVNYNLIVDLIGLFIFGAIGPTSTRASYALYELAKRKEYQKELYQEAQEINKRCNGNFKFDDIDKMVKLDSFLKESFRINSDLLGLPRKCIAESHFTFENGCQIPNGRMVSLNFLQINFDEKLQGQNPKEFYAFRHNSPATRIERNYVIFGLGKHSCPGRHYATTVIKIFLHHVMLKYNVKPVFENVVHRNHVGSFIGPLKSDKTGIVFENIQ